MVPLEFQCLQNLNCESTNKTLGHALEFVVLNEIVHVDAQTFESYQEVLPKHHKVIHSNDVVLIEFVVQVQILQSLQLDASLILELFLVSNDLDGDGALGLVV